MAPSRGGACPEAGGEVMKLLDFLLGTERNERATERSIIEALNNSRIRFGDLFTILEEESPGVYITKEGVGLLYEVLPPPYMGDPQESVIEQLFRIGLRDNTIVTFSCFASSNILPFLEAWKRSHSHVPNVRHPEVVMGFVNERVEFYRKAAKEGFWTHAKPRLFRNMVSFFFPFDTNPRETLRYAKEIRAKLEGTLRDFAPHPMPAEELVTILREIWNPDFEGVAQVNRNLSLSEQLLEHDTAIRVLIDEDGNGKGDYADLEISGRGKKRYWRGFWVRQYPLQLTLWAFSNLIFEWNDNGDAVLLPEPFYFSLQVRIRDVVSRKTAIEGKARWKVHQADKNTLIKFFPKLAHQAEHAKYVLELTENGKIPLDATLFFYVSAPDRTELEFISSGFENKMAQNGFSLTRETGLLFLNSFLENMPMNHYVSRNNIFARYSTKFDANIATFVPFVGQAIGSKDPTTLYVDRKFGLFGFNNFHSKTNYNVVIAAESGGGKSFGQGDYQLLSLAQGRVIRVIDIGRSYKPLCELIGGEYIELTEDRNPCFNPFTNVLSVDGKIHEDEMSMLVPLVGILCGVDISYSDKDNADTGQLAARMSSYISQAITNAYQKKGNKMGMRDVAEELKAIEDSSGEHIPQKLADALFPYSHGHYARYFNGENNISYSLDYVVLELEEVEYKEDRLKMAILFSLIMRIWREFMIWSVRGNARQKILVVDEAWSLLKLATASKFFETAARRFRKYDAALFVITQKINDFFVNPSVEAIYDNSAHKLVLNIKPEDIQRAIAENKFSANEFEKELLLSLNTVPGKFSELYINASTFKTVAKLIVDKYSYWTLTTRAEDRSIKQAVFERVGDMHKTLQLLAGVYPIGEILVDMGYLTPKQREIVLYLQNTYPGFVGKKFGEICVELGFLKPEDIERALSKQEEILQSIKAGVR